MLDGNNDQQLKRKSLDGKTANDIILILGGWGKTNNMIQFRCIKLVKKDKI